MMDTPYCIRCGIPHTDKCKRDEASMSSLEASARQLVGFFTSKEDTEPEPEPELEIPSRTVKQTRVRYTIHLTDDEKVEVIALDQPYYEDGWATFELENGNSVTIPRESVRFYTTEYLDSDND